MSWKFPKTVTRTGIALLALWVLSFALSYVDLGAAALPVAIAIAVAKATLVLMIFMELVKETTSVKLTFAAAAALLTILVVLILGDIGTRERPPLAPFGTEPGLPTAKLPTR